MNTINLWKETLRDLEDNEKTWDDIEYVIACQHYIDDPDDAFQMSKDDFKAIAEKYDYDNDFGRVYVPSSLKLIGKDFWLERHDYDGAECWHFKTLPVVPDRIEKVVRIDDWDGKFVLESDELD